jgi:CubicO group peptidase (beta-lactamase class C family)
MKKAIVISLIALLLNSAFVSAQTSPVASQTDFSAALDGYIRKVTEKLPDIPAIAVIVIKDDKPIFVRAYGTADREAGIKADENTMFYIASSTKAFTALSAAMLDKEGKIKFGDPVTKYFTGVQFKNAIPDKITVRDLLTHTSGLRNDALVNRLAATGQIDPRDLDRVFADGTTFNDANYGKYRYTNLGYNVYGALLDHHLKIKWQDAVQRRILNPMGMKHTSTSVSRAGAKKWTIAAPYVYDSQSGKTIRSVLEKNDNNMQSAGGMFASISDIGRWLNMQMNDGKLGGKQVMPADLIRASHAALAPTERNDPPFTDKGAYGLGWQVGMYRNEKVISHHGGFAGYSNHFSFLPEKKIAVAVVTNHDPVGQRAVHMIATYAYDWWLKAENLEADYAKRLQDLSDTYENRKKGSHAEALERAKRPSQLTKPLADYAGKYTHDLWGTMEIVPQDNALAIRWGNLNTVATPFTQPDSIRVVMIPGGNGDVIGFKKVDDKFVSLNFGGMTFTRVP